MTTLSPRTALLKLDVVLANHGHPDKSHGGQSEWEELGDTKAHALEDKEFAGKVAERDNVGPDGHVVDGAEVEVIGGVAADNAGDDGPCAKEAAGKGRHLVDGLGVLLVGGGNQLIGAVFRVMISRGGRETGVRQEAAIVDSSREVEGRVGLDRVADGDDGELWCLLARGW